MSQAKILDRVRKLLAKVAPTANTTEEEARTAAVMVCRALLEHGIVLTLPAPQAEPPPRVPPPRPATPSWWEPSWAPPPPPPSNGFGFGGDPFVRAAQQANARAAAEQERLREDAERIRREQAERMGRTPPQPSRDGMYEWIMDDLRRKHARAVEHEQQRRHRAKAARDSAEDLDAFDTVFGDGSREHRQRRSAAWRAAGKPKIRVYQPETDSYHEVPDYSGLSF